MNIQELDIQFGNEKLTLTNQRVIYWRRLNTLILSDLHLGKAAHFRKNGIPLPAEISQQDLYRLEQLLTHYQPQELIIVGDLIHAGENSEVSLFRLLTNKFINTKVTLIKGNHDRISLKNFNNMGISEVHESHVVDHITFSHQCLHGKGIYCISGHLHPGVNIMLPAKKVVRFPCFVVYKNDIILPAFSRFTGLDTKSLTGKPDCFALYEEGIFKVS